MSLYGMSWHRHLSRGMGLFFAAPRLLSCEPGVMGLPGLLPGPPLGEFLTALSRGELVAFASLSPTRLFAGPDVTSFACTAKLREHIVSWRSRSRGDTLQNMRVLLLPPIESDKA